MIVHVPFKTTYQCSSKANHFVDVLSGSISKHAFIVLHACAGRSHCQFLADGLAAKEPKTILNKYRGLDG